jgi:c(7)-type cytochrome triheme protein
MIEQCKNGEGRNIGPSSRRAARFIYCIIFFGMVLCSLAGRAHAVASGLTITYGGRGAGQVVFDGTVHAKELSCDDCHEPYLMRPALYAMKKGSETITMNKIERGRSCGRCHEVSMADFITCSKCHQPK